MLQIWLDAQFSTTLTLFHRQHQKLNLQCSDMAIQRQRNKNHEVYLAGSDHHKLCKARRES